MVSPTCVNRKWGWADHSIGWSVQELFGAMCKMGSLGEQGEAIEDYQSPQAELPRCLGVPAGQAASISDRAACLAGIHVRFYLP